MNPTRFVTLAAALIATAAAVDIPRPTTKPPVDWKPTQKPTVKPLPPPPVVVYCSANLDFPGFDFYNIKAVSHAGCYEQAKLDRRITAYSWTNYEGGTCWLKTGTMNDWKASPGMISCRVDDVRQQKSLDCDMPGADIGSKSLGLDYSGSQPIGAVFLAKCEDFCRGIEACNAVTFSDSNGGTCWFKSMGAVCKPTARTFSSFVLKRWYN